MKMILEINEQQARLINALTEALGGTVIDVEMTEEEEDAALLR